MLKTDSQSHSKALGYEAFGSSLHRVCIYCGERLAATFGRGGILRRVHACEEMKVARKPSAPIPFS